jgi:error-prone DNA polymerase
MSAAEVARVVAGRPYATLSDFWHRARVSRPVVERLVVAGAFDSLYGIGSPMPVRRRNQVTRRDLLLQVADLDRWDRPTRRGARGVRVDPRTDAPTDARTDARTDASIDAMRRCVGACVCRSITSGATVA